MNWRHVLMQLPLPPSANDLVMPWPTGKRDQRGRPIYRLIATPKAREYREAATAYLKLAMRQNGLKPMTGPVEIYATFSVPTIVSDGANRLKALEDALKGHAFLDDRQIAEWHLAKVIGKPSVLVTVLEAQAADAEFTKRLLKANAQPAKATKLATPAEYRP